MAGLCVKPDEMIVGCLSNDFEVLDRNLRSSPSLAGGRLALDLEADPPSASIGNNRLLDRNPGRICILAHHDVYLPNGWKRVLIERLAEVQAHDPDWGVIAAYGVGLDGRHWGPVWSSAISGVIGGVPAGPEPIQSADELLIIIRSDSGLRFDEDLPHFHFHGLDIVQTALAAGMGAYAVPLPLIHNDRFEKRLREDYINGYHFIRRKWRHALPLLATTTKVSWHGLHLHRSLRQMARYDALGAARASDPQRRPQHYAARCGWMTVC